MHNVFLNNLLWNSLLQELRDERITSFINTPSSSFVKFALSLNFGCNNRRLRIGPYMLLKSHLIEDN